MQYDVTTPDEYLEALDRDWRRETLLALRALILAVQPPLSEGIKYKMLCYDDADGEGVIGLNAQKNYVSLYVGTSAKIDPTGALLAGLNCGKGCVRFTKSKRVADTRIGEFIARAVELHAQGIDISC